MARSSRIHFATELLSVHLERHSVPFSAGFLSAGGFTIEDASGASDPEWRSLQEGLVRRDAERMTAAISDASREIGPEAWASLILRQDGLPYGLLLPNATGRSSPLASCLLSLLGREAFHDVDFLAATLLRRRHISFDSAISYLVDRAMPMIIPFPDRICPSDIETSGSGKIRTSSRSLSG